MKALATVGIQKGHMALHAQNVAMWSARSATRSSVLAKILVEKRQKSARTSPRRSPGTA